MKNLKAIWVATALFALSFTCAAAEEQYSGAQSERECTQKDLAGTYVLMTMRETPPKGETRFYKEFSHQYMAFYPDNVYASGAFAQAMDTPAKLEPHLRVHRKKYSLMAHGVLNMYTYNNTVYSYRCIAHLTDNEAYKKGDIELAGYSGKSSTTEIYKLYRHWY